MEQRAAEREPLRHAARVRGDAVGARLPEAEALEQHPDALPSLGDPVQPPVQVEVLERGQLAVDERLVPEEADVLARGLDVQLATGRQSEPGAESEERRLPRSVRAGHEQEASARELEVESAEHALLAEPLLDLPRADHAVESTSGRAPWGRPPGARPRA